MASAYLSHTWNRDRIMGIVQFAPMVLSGPTAALGLPNLTESLLKLSSLADGYRTVTRCSCMIDMTSPEKIQGALSISDPVARKLAGIEFFVNFLYFPFEHVGLLSTYGVLDGKIVNRVRGMCAYFWFWGLATSLWNIAYKMLLAFPYLTPKATDAASIKRRADFRKLILQLVKTVSFLLFALSVLPANGKPQLLAKPAGLLRPLHRFVELTTPKAITLSTPAKGLLGLVATLTDFV